MQWITREQVRVGRMGCAWLIRRFIDQDAEILTVPGDRVLSEAERLGATPFHTRGAALTRQGDKSSFEVVLEAYGLTSDAALALLGRIVTAADIPRGPTQQAEGPGLKAVSEGVVAHYPTDAERIAAMAAVYDALYAYCQEMVRLGKPLGAFAS